MPFLSHTYLLLKLSFFTVIEIESFLKNQERVKYTTIDDTLKELGPFVEQSNVLYREKNTKRNTN